MSYRASYTYGDRPAYEAGRTGARTGARSSGQSSRFSQVSRSSRPSRTSRTSRSRANTSTRSRAQSYRVENSQPNSADDKQQNRAPKQTLFSRFSQATHDAKRARSKKRAERLSGRQFANTEKSDASAGPRAALYKGEMGRSHRQSQHMMENGPAQSSSGFHPVSIPAGKNAPHSERKSMRHPVLVGIGGFCAVVVLSCAFMYGSLQTNYKTMREYERVQAEYAAVVERNNELQDSIDSLSTDAGVKAYVHDAYGWVSAGESSGTVQGLEESDVDKTSTVNPSIQPGSIKAPEQWYTKYLDAIFGVSE